MSFSTVLSTAAVASVSLSAAIVHGAETRPLPKSFDLQAIDAYLAEQARKRGFVGLSVAIMKEGKIVLARGYGKASIANDLPVEADTAFAAGSITKQFTCAAIMLLAEEGKLSIEDKVAQYYPNLTRARDISLYDLMTHVSGYPDYYPLDFVDRRMKRAIELDQLIERYAGARLDFEPGSRWSYSNTGYVILGRIVEKVSGQPFGGFLSQRVLKPAGMDHSYFEPATGQKGLATGYTAFALGDPEPAVPEASGWIHAAGGLYTTPSDLCKWDLALADGKVVKPQSLQMMLTPRKLKDGRMKNYGCGLSIAAQDGETIAEHAGAVSGFLAFNAAVPRTRSAVVVMMNAEYVDGRRLLNELLSLLLKATAAEAPAIPKVDGPAATEAALELLHQLQAGEIKREALGEEYNLFLTPEKVKAAQGRLKALGEPSQVESKGAAERGGMEVTQVEFTFKDARLKASLYRSPDGKIQQFLLVRP